MNEMAKWGEVWRELPQAEKDDYRKRAKSIDLPVQGEKKVLANLYDSINSLGKLGYTLTCQGMNSQGQLFSCGVGKAHHFMESNPSIIRNLYTDCVNKASEDSTETLRKNVTNHLRNLHEQATGCRGAFPYKKVAAGDITVQGLPSHIYPLRLPSHYGREKLKTILECKKITVTANDVTSRPSSADFPEVATQDFQQEDQQDPVAQICENEFLLEEAEKVLNEMSKGKIDISEEVVSNVPPKKKKRKNTKETRRQATKKIKGEELYLVEDILKEGPNESLVKWIGFPVPTWEKNENLIEI